MKRHKANAIKILALTFIFLGCSTMNKNQTSSAFKINKFETQTLQNGLQILWLPDTSLPRTSLQLIIKTGSVYESAPEAGLNSLVAGMLSESTKKRSALEMAEQLESNAIDFSSKGQADFTFLSVSALNIKKEQMLDFFTESLFEPAFKEADFKRRLSNTLAGIKKIADQPAQVADIMMLKNLYTNHAYGRLVSGSPDTLTKFEPSDCSRFYKSYYRPQRAMLAVTGHFDDDFKKQIIKSFLTWEKWEDLGQALPPQMPPQMGHVFVNKKDLEQTEIRFAHLGISRNNPDYLALRLANMPLGGSFASRLNQKIRDDLGLTYNINSSFDTQWLSGNFDISTFTRHDKVSEMVVNVNQVFKEFAEKGITGSELSSAKAILIGQFPMALETTDRMAFNALSLWAYGVSFDYLTQFQENVNAITLEQVNQAIKKHFFPENLKITIYSDQSKIKSEMNELKKQGYSFVTQEFKL